MKLPFSVVAAGLAALTALIAVTPCPAEAASPPALHRRKGMVAADNESASQAGAEILRQGGDAVDAAVATALMLGVVQPFASGLGGGGFALVYRADGTPPYTLDFREVAPAAATANMYQDAKGNVVPGASTTGPKAAGVPGELAGLFALHKRHGKLPWKTVVEPALRAARDGFPAGELLCQRVARKRDDLARWPALAAQFLHTDGTPILPGERVRRLDLAKTLAVIARDGAAALYTGEVGKDLAAAMAHDGGLITRADLAAYAVKEREPLSATYRGYTVLSMPPPSSGGAVLLQVLRVLEATPLAPLGHNSGRYLHRLVEAVKHGFSDRAAVMGDPDFTPVPVAELLGDAAIAHIRAATLPQTVHPISTYGTRTAGATLPEDHGTSHLNVIDPAGNTIALTTTVNTVFGSFYVAGDTGLLMNDEMDDFVAKPGVPNAFGLVGREANAIAPGKRPLSSMTPTLVLKDGKVVLAVGASGGPTIITGTLQVLLNVLDFGMDPQAAVEAPRVHHQWMPEWLSVEPELPFDVRETLARRGHIVKVDTRTNAVQAITAGPDGLRGASDPSKQGRPAGVD